MTAKVLIIKKSEESVNPEIIPDDSIFVYEDKVKEGLEGRLKNEKENSFDKVILVDVLPTETIQGQLFKLLTSKGKMMIDGVPDRESGQSLAVDLKISGFLDIMAAKDPSSGRRFIVCQRPDYETGSTAKLSLISTPITNSEPGLTKWRVAITDTAEEDLIDENALLEESSIPVPNPMDCGTDSTGKRRACKDCSCGLAEVEAKGSNAESVQPKTIEEKIVKSSSCGNCTKGDAFRCAGCPFLGKPAFEPGMEKVILSMGVDDI
jgi:hypothetical protein